MSTDAKKSVIHRKAIGARNEFDARVMSPAKSLRLALAKSADKMFGLALTVTTVEQLVLPHAKVKEEAGSDALLLLLDGAGGHRGAAKVDPQFLTALIEVQTTGAVRRKPAEERVVTRTDAAIAAPLLDNILSRFDSQLAEADPKYVAQEYRFGDMIEDARTLSLTLEAPEYDLFRLSLDIEDGAKTGMLTFLMPKRPENQRSDKGQRTRAGAEMSLEKSALEAQAVLDAILPRLTMPLRDVCALQPGMQLALDAECLTKAKILGPGGHVVARVRLGQMNGMRAVRFVAPASADNTHDADAADTSLSGRKPKPVPTSMTDHQDDVIDGIGLPVPNKTDDAVGEVDLSETDAALKDDPASNEEELSAADLMLAATAPQNQHEDA